MATSTPWGPAQNSTKIAPGIMLYSCAGHGGIHLSPTRQKEFKSKFPEFQTWIKGGEWFEEDCDVCVIILAFPQYFKAEDIQSAFNHVAKDQYFVACVNSAHWPDLTRTVQYITRDLVLV